MRRSWIRAAGFLAALIIFVSLLGGCQEISSLLPQAPEATEAANGAGGEDVLQDLLGLFLEESAEEEAIPDKIVDSWYHYRYLDESSQTVYRALYRNIVKMNTEEFAIPETDADLLSSIYQKVIYDNPQLFWVDNFVLYTYSLGSSTMKQTIALTYAFSQEEKEDRQTRIEREIIEIFAGLPAEADDYGKLKYLFRTLAERTSYNEEAPDNQNICSVFLHHESVCQGYAMAMQLLATRAGIPCITVSGVADGNAHAWNIVWADGEPYCVDPTWGDPYGVPGVESYFEDVVWYACFMVPSERFDKSHTADAGFVVPECTAEANTYYVRENCVITSLDEAGEAQIKDLLVGGLQDNNGLCFLYFEDGGLFEEAKRSFIDDGEIYRLLREIRDERGISLETGSVYYMMPDDEKILVFQAIATDK